MIVPFTHMGCFLITDSSKNYLDFCDRELTFTFKDYVLCCLNMPLLTQMHRRDFKVFWESRLFLEGDKKHESAYRIALGYFYQDLSSLVTNLIKHRKSQEDFPIFASVCEEKVPDGFVLNRIPYLEAKESVAQTLANRKDSSIGGEFLTRFTISEVAEMKPSNRLACLAILASASTKINASVVIEVVSE